MATVETLLFGPLDDLLDAQPYVHSNLPVPYLHHPNTEFGDKLYESHPESIIPPGFELEQPDEKPTEVEEVAESDGKQAYHIKMALQAHDALNRTFLDLKSKNEEVRLRASYDLRDQVSRAVRGNALLSPAELAY